MGRWLRVEHRDARKRHNSPDGHGLKWYHADSDDMEYWDGDHPELGWQPIPLERAQQLWKHHRLPNKGARSDVDWRPNERLTSYDSAIGLTREHFAPWEGMPEADNAISALRDRRISIDAP